MGGLNRQLNTPAYEFFFAAPLRRYHEQHRTLVVRANVCLVSAWLLFIASFGFVLVSLAAVALSFVISIALFVVQHEVRLAAQSVKGSAFSTWLIGDPWMRSRWLEEHSAPEDW